MPTLYVVATPIGNLSDISPRALEALSRVALIAAEDTRVTGNLLRHFGIAAPMTSLHRHNEAGKAGGIVRRMLEEDIDAVLVTDAGTPGISDPGHLLVREAAEAGIAVVPVPGPSAMAAALSVSGFDARTFAFYGFLPRERGDLLRALHALAEGPPVAVLHESPHRIIGLLEAIAEALPGNRVCACCDLTKLYERTDRGSAREVLAVLHDNPKADKGEYCVVLDLHDVERMETPAAPPPSAEAQALDLLRGGMDAQGATAVLVERGLRKNEAKRAVLFIQRAFSGKST